MQFSLHSPPFPESTAGKEEGTSHCRGLPHEMRQRSIFHWGHTIILDLPECAAGVPVCNPDTVYGRQGQSRKEVEVIKWSLKKFLKSGR